VLTFEILYKSIRNMMEIKVWDFKFRVASRALHTQQRTDVTITPISCE